MSELFKGAVLYKPSPSEVLNLRNTIDFINDNPINIDEVFDKHTTPHWWANKIDWVTLTAELDSFIGWRWESLDKYGEYRCAEKRWWVNSISEILDMLDIDGQCYITPTQARAIKHAQNALQQIKDIK